MADLSLVTDQIATIYPQKAEIHSYIAAEAITAGQAVYTVAATGKVGVAEADAAGKQQARGIALQGVGAGQAVEVLRRGHLHGFTLTSQNYDDPIYLSDTAGALADAAGTLAVPIGLVVALPDKGLTKVLFVDCRMREDYS